MIGCVKHLLLSPAPQYARWTAVPGAKRVFSCAPNKGNSWRPANEFRTLPRGLEVTDNEKPSNGVLPRLGENNTKVAQQRVGVSTAKGVPLA